MLIFTNTTKTDTPENIEGDNLSAHVLLCRQRDSTVKNRMDEIEDRQDKIEQREHELRTYILRTITTAAFALLSSAASLIIIIIEFIKK